MLRAMTDDGSFRVMTIGGSDTASRAIAAQRVEGHAALQLGEIVTAAVLVRETMAPGHRVQVLLRDQPGNQVVGDAFPDGRTRGLAQVSDDVLGVLLADGGYLQVMRSLPGRAPHQGVVEARPESGIDQAVRAYFLQSEQIETFVGVSCHAHGESYVAGGYVVQLLPELTEPPLEAMRARLAEVGRFGAELVERGGDPQWILDNVLGEASYTSLADSTVGFGCQCGRDKALGAVAALGEAEVKELLRAGEVVRVNCDYCRSAYEVGPADLRAILEP